MKVLFAITNGDVGGAQEHMLVTARGFIERGHEVAILVPVPSPMSDRLDAEGIRVLPWRHVVRAIRPLRDLRARRELRRAVAEIRPDVLHVQTSKAGVLARGVLSPPDGVCIYTCHHPAFGPGRRLSHRIISRPIEQLTLPLLDGIITDGARDAPILSKLARSVPVTVIRNAAPPVGAEPDLTGIPPKVAVWVARMAHPKDPLQAIAAWGHVVRAHPDARLLMCGVGPLLDQVRAAAAASPAAGAIEVLGRVDDLEAVLRQGSVYLLPTQAEGGNTMATLEAMSVGLVPVLSDAGDAFLLTHARCGVVVPRRAPRALARAVVGLFDDPDAHRAARGRAVDFARRGWSVDDMVDATLDVYRSVRGRHGSEPVAG